MKSVILTLFLLLVSCQTSSPVLNPPQILPPTLSDSSLYVFGRVGQPPYIWVNKDGGGYVAQLQDAQSSPTQYSRFEIDQTQLGGTRSGHVVVNGWIQPSQEVSLTRASQDLDWTEFAWQVYQGNPQMLPVSIVGPGSVTNQGTWTWSNTDGATKQGTWSFISSWTWDGTTINVHGIWTQTEDNGSSATLDTVSHFTKYGFIGWDDLTNHYSSCIEEVSCQ